MGRRTVTRGSLANDPAAFDARVVKALSHPTRRRILELLQVRELASPVELAAELGIPLGTVSYHVRKLETLGFIELAKRTQRRGAIEHHYRASATLDRPRRRRRAAPATDSSAGATAALQAIEAAQSALARGGFEPQSAGVFGRLLALDARGATLVEAAVRRSRASVERICRASERRTNGSGADGVRQATAVVGSFELDSAP